jgi:hypothetical protein
MRVLVTGATGFVGRHVVPALLARGCAVTVLCRDAAKAQAMPWGQDVEIAKGDLAGLTPAQLDHLAEHERILHLAWEGLPNYKAETQITEVLPRHLEFLRQLIERGAKHLLVTGTCLEYGLVEGALSEGLEPAPVTAYGRAKDALRGLEPLCEATAHTSSGRACSICTAPASPKNPCSPNLTGLSLRAQRRSTCPAANSCGTTSVPDADLLAVCSCTRPKASSTAPAGP